MNQRLHILSKKFGRLAYQKKGRGPVIMLIHGFPSDSDLWQRIDEDLAAYFSLILPDLPGTGASDFYSAGITMEDMAMAINEILENEKTDKLIIAGHSMGGYVSLAFAAMFPEKLAGLALVHSTAYADDDTKKENRAKAIELMKKGGSEVFLKQMVPALFSEVTKIRQPELIQETLHKALKVPIESLISFYNSMMYRPDRLKVLSEARFPIQWIIGKEDKAIPPVKALEQSTLSDISFVNQYDDCAHMSMLEQPALLLKDLIAFACYCNNR